MSKGPHWSEEEDAHLRAALRAGLSVDDAAHEIGRCRESCLRRVYYLGLPIPDTKAWSGGKPRKRQGFAFANVQARGTDASARAAELKPRAALALKRFSWEADERS